MKSAKADAKVLKDAKTKKYVPGIVQSWGLVNRTMGTISGPQGPNLFRVSEWNLLEISVFRVFLLLLPLNGRVGS